MSCRRAAGYLGLFTEGVAALDLGSRLRADEAISTVLLTATGIGLATCLLTEPLEVVERRVRLHDELLFGTAYDDAYSEIAESGESHAPNAQ
ncbi:hypothetical protein [Nocardia fluminea]|uniref:hypothetical protein n=1 Tax=Nocardia fluminea TaxID=134984 RepID=UPI003D148915